MPDRTFPARQPCWLKIIANQKKNAGALRAHNQKNKLNQAIPTLRHGYGNLQGFAPLHPSVAFTGLRAWLTY